jgi:hypothetical protein
MTTARQSDPARSRDRIHPQAVARRIARHGTRMLMCEFLTATQHKLPVKAVVYNNSSLGLIT